MNAISIRRADPEDADVIHAVQMRAFAEEARLGDERNITPLTDPVADIVPHIRTQTVLTAREGERIVGAATGWWNSRGTRVRSSSRR